DQHGGHENDRRHESRPVSRDVEEGPGGQRGGGDVGDGDPDHGRGEDALGLAEGIEGPHGHAGAAPRGVAQAHPVGGDEGHLGGGEDGGHDHGGHDGPDVDHAARLPPTRWRSWRRTSTIRVRCTFSTATVTSSVCVFSPLWGTRPNRSRTHPPTVLKAWLGKLRPVAALSSSMGSCPETRKVVAARFWLRRSSSSNSSLISPTSSSSRSSRATGPAVPPYSSTTTARWILFAWNSRRRASARLDSGTK